MKIHTNNYIMTFLAGAALLFSACAEADKVIDEVFENETRGAILRTVNIISGELPIGDPESTFEVELEVQSEEDGTLVEFVEVYYGFRDNTVEDGAPDLSKDQVLAETVDSSTFTTGEFGYPRFTYSATVGEMSAVLGLSDTDVNGGDQFEIRFELVLNDGRRYSFDDNTGTLTGSFFSSQFLYTPAIVCPVRAPTPGVWTIEMQDSYGDGWQTNTGSGGDGLTVTLDDGTVFEVGLCSPYTSAEGTFLGGSDCTPNDGSSGTATVARFPSRSLPPMVMWLPMWVPPQKQVLLISITVLNRNSGIT
ncbi:MAG: hypothetical protein P8Z38_04930 [Robiginitalea sp.]